MEMMMSEALRLADELVSLHGYPLSIKAAAELRRLHNEVIGLKQALEIAIADDAVFKERDRLQEANQAMLEALKLCLDGFEDVSKNHGVSYITEIVDARAAIAKGEAK